MPEVVSGHGCFIIMFLFFRTFTVYNFTPFSFVAICFIRSMISYFAMYCAERGGSAVECRSTIE